MNIDDKIKEFRATSGDPLWKIVLNWGTVVLFLTLPLAIAAVQIYSNTHRGWWVWMENLTPAEHERRFQYLNDFMRNLTILVFGLAGLRTWENIRNGKAQNDRRKPEDRREEAH